MLLKSATGKPARRTCVCSSAERPENVQGFTGWSVCFISFGARIHDESTSTSWGKKLEGTVEDLKCPHRGKSTNKNKICCTNQPIWNQPTNSEVKPQNTPRLFGSAEGSSESRPNPKSRSCLRTRRSWATNWNEFVITKLPTNLFEEVDLCVDDNSQEVNFRCFFWYKFDGFGQSWSEIQLHQPCYSGWYSGLRRKILPLIFKPNWHKNSRLLSRVAQAG